MKTKQKITLALLIMIAGTSWYGYKQYTRKNTDLAYAKADLEITSSNLIKSFETNEKLSNEKFLDKIIAVSGKVSEINKDEKGYYTLVLGEDSSMSSVRCCMDSVHQQTVFSLKSGDRVTIKGACTGFNADELLGSDVILNRCVVKK
ncbi:MAG: hypothetical protein ACHQF0_17065 [Chitinophagales bacterium]